MYFSSKDGSTYMYLYKSHFVLQKKKEENTKGQIFLILWSI